jgi:oligopeptidase A
MSFAKHYQTGEQLPDAMYERLIAAKNFRSGSALLRQVRRE